MCPEFRICEFIHYLREEEVISILRCHRAIDDMGSFRAEYQTQAHIPMLLQEFVQDKRKVSLFPELVKVIPEESEHLDVTIADCKFKPETLHSRIRRIVKLLLIIKMRQLVLTLLFQNDFVYLSWYIVPDWALPVERLLPMEN